MKNLNKQSPGGYLLAAFFVFMMTVGASAQSVDAQITTTPTQATVSSSAPLTLTLQDCLARAKKINPQYYAALTELGIAREDRVQSRAALLPNANYNASLLYTQGNGTTTGRFIGANGVHEYISQGNIRQVLSLGNVADYRRTQAAEALARANAEIAARGLMVTVVQAYYGLVSAEKKYATTQRALDEAQHFTDVTEKLERGGEVAHSDVIKAQIQLEQQQRDLQETQLNMDRGRLELAVLIFPDFNENFTVIDDLQPPEMLPDFPEIQTKAAKNNPELHAAFAAMQEAKQEVNMAWNGFLPAVELNYAYGIDANQFAARSDGIHNLGYAATATLQLPIWNWGANRSRLKQAGLRREQAQVELSSTQRQLLSDLHIFFEEAQTSRAELESLMKSADLAAQSATLTMDRYQAGEATVLEAVDAQNTLTLARNALADGQLRFRVTIANLQTLTGTF